MPQMPLLVQAGKIERHRRGRHWTDQPGTIPEVLCYSDFALYSLVPKERVSPFPSVMVLLALLRPMDSKSEVVSFRPEGVSPGAADVRNLRVIQITIPYGALSPNKSKFIVV
jgi:hypothetical protein